MARTLSLQRRIGDSSNRLALFGSIGLALLAAIFAFASLRAAGGDDGGTASDVANVSVVVAAQEIRPGTSITEDMLTLTTAPEDKVIDGYLTSLDDLSGSVAQYPLERGEQVTALKLGQGTNGDGGPLGRIVPRGKRAVTVGVTEEKIFGGLLAPGDRVDVIAVVERTVGDTEVPTAITIVQNAEVLAVAAEQLRPVARTDLEGNPIETEDSEGVLAAAPDDVDAQPEARNVTIAVSPDDALAITLAQEEWSVWLTLRGPDDEDTPPVAPRTLEFD